MNNDNATTPQNVTNPENWDLALRIGKDGLDYTLNNPSIEGSMLYGSVSFDNSGTQHLKRMENSFYDFPLLVDYYDKVSVVFDNSQFLIVPDEFFDNDNIESLFQVSFPGFNGDLIAEPLKSCEAHLIFGLNRGVKSFLHRTYANTSIKHCLHPLIEFFGRRARLGNSHKMYVTLIADKAYIMAFESGKLAIANVLPYRHISDVAYYLLGLWKEVHFEQQTDELQISGDSSQRKELMDILREYISLVMPSLFPPALLKINRDAPKIPFDLMLLSLCE